MSYFTCEFGYSSRQVSPAVFCIGHPALVGEQTGSAAIALAYARWGEGFAAHLDGAFAAAVFDPKLRQLVCASDELGVLPIFYAAQADAMVVSSSLKRLVARVGIGVLDEAYIADYLAEGWHLGARTPFAAIKRLLPGEILRVSKAGINLRRDLRLGAIAPLAASGIEEAAHAFRAAFDTAMQVSLPADGKFGCELSGGLDSSSIYLAARHAAPGRIEAITTLFPRSPKADEREWAGAVMANAPAPWHVLDGDAHAAFSAFETETFAEPSAQLVNAAYGARYREILAQANVTTVLTGQGGDAVLHGDGTQPYHIADLLRRLAWPRAAAEAQRYANGSLTQRAMLRWFLQFGVVAAYRHARHHLLRWDAPGDLWFAPDYKRLMALDERGLANPFPKFGAVQDSWFMQRVLTSARLVSVAQHQDERFDGYRHPFLTRGMVALMLAVQQPFRTHPEIDRVLQRHALRDVLPPRILLRRSKGGPTQATLRSFAGSAAWQAHLTEDSQLVARGYVREAAWRSAVRQAAAGAVPDMRRFMSSVIMETWLKQHTKLNEPLAAATA